MVSPLLPAKVEVILLGNDSREFKPPRSALLNQMIKRVSDFLQSSAASKDETTMMMNRSNGFNHEIDSYIRRRAERINEIRQKFVDALFEQHLRIKIDKDEQLNSKLTYLFGIPLAALLMKSYMREKNLTEH